MTGQAIAAPRVDAGEQTYRQAERALWAHYRLEPLERFVDVRGVRLRVLELGSGEPALFVHGTGGPGTWPSLAGALSGYRCLLLDRPGWGLSAPVDYSGHEYKTFVADLPSGVLDDLGVERAHAPSCAGSGTAPASKPGGSPTSSSIGAWR
jgi:hypothetical protein